MGNKESIVDNEAIDEVEEQDIFGLLAGQSEESEEEELEEFDGDLPDDPELLKQKVREYQERISKRNKSLKMRSDATHRMQDEIKALTEKIEAIQTRSDAPNAEAQNQEYKETLEKWRDSVDNDPKLAIDFATWQANQMQERFVDVIANMQSGFEAKLAELKGELDPEKAKYRDKINALKSNPKFAGLDEGALKVFAEEMSNVKVPRGPIGGRRAAGKPDPEKELEALKQQYRKQMQG